MDQVLHPYETQHTLKELAEIFEETGVELVGTSINHFEPIHNIEDLYHVEEGLYDEGMDYLNRKEYYPGFFYVLGKKK